MSRPLALHWTWLLTLLFGALALLYGVTTPPWEASDELGHYDYVRHLVQSRTFLRQSVDQPNLGHHPPLYYLIAGAFAWPADMSDAATAPVFNALYVNANNGGHDPNVAVHTTALTFPWSGQALALHLARVASALIGVATTAAAAAAARLAFARWTAVLLAVGLVAFDPELAFVHGAITNDALAGLAGSLVFLQTLRAVRGPARLAGWAWVGVWLAVGLLAKSSLVAAAGAVGMVVLWLGWRAHSARLVGRAVAAIGMPVVALSGWWFVRNQLLYGDPLGYGVYRKAWWPSLRTAPLRLSDLVEFVTFQFRSFWAWFGWLTVPGPRWFHLAALALCLVAVVGLLRLALGQRRELLGADGRCALGLAALFLVVQEAYMVTVILDCNSSCYQGRYLFPVVAPIGLLLGAGVAAALPNVALPAVAPALVAGLFAVAAWTPFGVILPAYNLVPMEKWQVARLPADPPTRVGSAFDLISHDAQPAAGGKLAVTLYWRAAQKPDFDYSAFVHLIDDGGNLLAQKDQGPGAPRGFPPKSWSVGDVVADEHDLDVGSLPPGRYRVRVGLYNWANGQQLLVVRDGQPVGTFLILPEPVELPVR